MNKKQIWIEKEILLNYKDLPRLDENYSYFKDSIDFDDFLIVVNKLINDQVVYALDIVTKEKIYEISKNNFQNIIIRE